jgi:hypothetical protein
LQPQNRKSIFIKNKILLFSVVLLCINATSVDSRNGSESAMYVFDNLNFPKSISNTIFYLERDFVAFKEALAFKESHA